MRELHHPGFPNIFNCNQTGACRQYGLVLICPPPIWIRPWNSPLEVLKVHRKDFCELFNTQRPKGGSETLEETTRVLSICLIDIL